MFILTIISAVILWRTYDALRALQQTNRVSLIWHSISFLFMFLLSGFVYYHFYGFTLLGWKYAMLTAVTSWWLCDIIFNLINKQNPFYGGDGKGSRLEIIFTKIGNRVNLDLWIVILIAKVLVTVSTVIIVSYGKAIVSFVAGVFA